MDSQEQSKCKLLASSNDDDHTDSSVSVMDQDLTLPGMGGYYFVAAVRGLVCFTFKNKVRICNVNTRQVVELPPVTRSEAIYEMYYFGHDHVHDEYKVIHVSEKSSEHQVLVLGAGASWRNIQCHIPHHSFSAYPRGITINGVLYYIAYTDAYSPRLVFMSFDWNSEEFKLIKFPDKVNVFVCCYITFSFMNYRGKLGFCYYRSVRRGRTMNIWVLEDAEKSRWSDKKTFAVPVSQMNIAHIDRVMMGGTSHSDKVWLVNVDVMEKYQPTRFFIYDLERNEVTKTIEIGTQLFHSFKEAKILHPTFWDDNKNIMYLET